MSMKDLLNKMSQLEALPAPKARQVLNESSPSPAPVATTTKRSLKDVFNELHEAIPAGAKPLPIMDPTNKKAGMGFVTSNNPAVQNIILKNLDPKDVQIVQAPGQTQPGQPNQQQTQQKSLQPMQASNQPNKTVQEDDLDEMSGSFRTASEKSEKIRQRNLKKAEKHARDFGIDAAIANYDLLASDVAELRRRIGGEEHVAEGAKVDRMVKHVKKSEEKAGKSKKEAENIAWATANKRGMLDNKNKKKVKEGDIAPTNGIDTMGAGLGRGRSKTTLEGKKPDFLDLDKDGNRKEPMKKAAVDKKKKAVKENMNNRIQAARLEGKAHGLKGHPHCGKNYDDMEEGRAYHEGFKEGLDECYGMSSVVGHERETRMPVSTRTMARNTLNTPLDEMIDDDDDFGPRRRDWTPGDEAEAADDQDYRDWWRKPDPFDPTNRMDDEDREIDEMSKTAYMKQQARKTPGNTFKAFGQTMHDKDVLEGDFAFEAWDRQLNSLINEGFSVSISKGEPNSPDSVNVNATDAEADKLLSLVKHAGMGIFGGDDGSDYGSPEMGGASEINSPGGIEVVGDHDGMLGLMKKLSGIQGSSSDYEEEGCEECGHSPCNCNEKEEMSESRCDECGMMESKCGCNEEVLDEVESEDQMESKVAEGGAQNPPDSGAANATNDTKGNAAANAALAKDQSVQEELEGWMNEKDAEGNVPAFMRKKAHYDAMDAETGGPALRRVKDEPKEKDKNVKEEDVKESFANLYKKLAMLSEESEQLDELSPELLSRAGEEARRRQQRAANVLPVEVPTNNWRIRYNGQWININTAEKIKKAIGLGDLAPDTEVYDRSEPIGAAIGIPGLKAFLKPENPASQFFGQKVDKFNKAATRAAIRDQDRDQYNRQTADMSRAQRSRFDKMQQGEKVNEWANQIGKGPGKGTDASFEQDIDFMTKVISGGLNKPKSTGQTTVPVVASQLNRQNDQQHVNESFMHLYKKLAILSEESAVGLNAEGDWDSYEAYADQKQRYLNPDYVDDDEDEDDSYQNPNRYPNRSPDPSYDEDDELYGILKREIDRKGDVRQVGRMKEGSDDGLNAEGDWDSYEAYADQKQRYLNPDYVDDDDSYQNPNRSPDPSYDEDDELYGILKRDRLPNRGSDDRKEFVGRTIGGYDQPTERNPYGNQKFNVPPGREFRPRPHTPDGLGALKNWKELGPSDRKEEL